MKVWPLYHPGVHCCCWDCAHTLLYSAQHEDILIKQFVLLDSPVDTVVAGGSGVGGWQPCWCWHCSWCWCWWLTAMLMPSDCGWIMWVSVRCHRIIPSSHLIHCTAGHECVIADLSCMSIFSHFQGLQTPVQLVTTTWSAQIWISGWILPHFDVRTISVAWKLKKLSNIFWQKIFFLWHHA